MAFTRSVRAAASNSHSQRNNRSNRDRFSLSFVITYGYRLPATAAAICLHLLNFCTILIETLSPILHSSIHSMVIHFGWNFVATSHNRIKCICFAYTRSVQSSIHKHKRTDFSFILVHTQFKYRFCIWLHSVQVLEDLHNCNSRASIFFLF